jgi:hypothetical protein
VKLFLSFFFYAIVTGIGYLIMIFGWGLTAQSWGWILGGSFVNVLLAAVFTTAKEEL